jgi:hypothetical protein
VDEMRKGKMFVPMIVLVTTALLLQLNGVSAESDCKIVDYDVPPKVINYLADLDEAVPIRVTIRNDGDTSGIYTLVVKVNGVEDRSVDVKVGSGDTEEYVFELRLYGDPVMATYPWNRDVGATYEIELDGHTATTLVTSFPNYFWFSIGLDVIGLIGSVLFIRHCMS